MEIQWFPGHMTKSMRMMEENVALCDGIIFVLDARAPFSCINQKLLTVFGSKPVVYALNKSDLVSKESVSLIVKELKNEGKTAVSLNGTQKRDVASLYNAVTESLKEKLESYKKKGIVRPLRIMVAGVPNTGKSTIINSFCGEKRAVTGDKAGVTRGKQWIRLKEIELLDTPGTMPPKFENQYYAKHLAYIGSINDAILDKEGLALELISELSLRAPNCLSEKYGIENIGEIQPIEIFELICKKRGFIMRGNEFDYERGAIAVLDDFRKGRIGKICFETERYNEKNN